MSPFSNQFKITFAAICFMTFLECVGYMAVMPSLIFYVRELGGSDEQYGLILASANFSSFLMMPLYGSWVDALGNKYRLPLFFGSIFCITGMILYSVAICFPKPIGVWVLLLSRIIYGIGASSGSIYFSYITSVVEHDQLTYCTQLLSMATYGGLAVGPFFNSMISNVNTEWNVLGSGWILPLDALNAVGLLIATNDIIALVLMYLYVPEPPNKEKSESEAQTAGAAAADTTGSTDAAWSDVFKELKSFRLLLPLITTYVVGANYQLIEASFSPAAMHGLGWGPVQTSAVLGGNTVTLVLFTFISLYLSTEVKVRDGTMIMVGFMLWFVAGIGMYAFWIYPATAMDYVVPISIGLAGYPLIGPATRSEFSRYIHIRPELEPLQARLQSIIGMANEVASFTTPLFVGACVLRSPEEVEAGKNNHELTPFALYIPVFSAICILGWFYNELLEKDDVDEAEELVTEGTPLVSEGKKPRHSIACINSEFSAKNEVNRLRSASIILGAHRMSVVVPFETDPEKKLREKLMEEKKQWENMIRDMEQDE